MKLGINRYRGVDVIVTDWRQIQNKELQTAFRQQMAQTCCTTFKFPREMDMNVLNSYYQATECPHYQSLIGKLGTEEPIISIDYGLIERCSPGELNALLAHEYSHVKNRDYDRHNPSGEVHTEIEMRCDADAAKLFGPEDMKNGLIRVVEHQCEIDLEGRFFSDLKTELSSRDMVQRMEALDKMD